MCIIEYIWNMETKTINLRNLPEDLVRRAKACAALHGLTLKDFAIRALESATQKDIPASAGSLAFISARRRSSRAKL
jgi:plasmid stability protein